MRKNNETINNLVSIFIIIMLAVIMIFILYGVFSLPSNSASNQNQQLFTITMNVIYHGRINYFETQNCTSIENNMTYCELPQDFYNLDQCFVNNMNISCWYSSPGGFFSRVWSEDDGEIISIKNIT